MTFSHTGLLLFGGIALAACALLWRGRGGLYPAMLFPLWAMEGSGRRRHTWRRTLTHLVRAALLVVLAVLAAGPLLVFESSTREPRETVVLVLDVSSTMTATDFPGGRLGAVKGGLGRFIRKLPAADIGLVTFAATPEVRVPPTAERAPLLADLEATKPAAYGEDGTAIGSALANGVERARNGLEGRKRLLMITDGISNRGAVSAGDAARLAAGFGIRIDVIGLGGDEPTRFRAPVSEAETEELEARLEIDERALREISRVTGGQYLRARDVKGLDDSLSTLAGGFAASRSSGESARRRDWLPVLQMAALSLLLLELACGALLTPEAPL
jgi:Ca-activated chloride channel homolog